MFKDFFKKAEEKAKEYTKKTKDYVESDEFKGRVNTLKEKTSSVAKEWEEKGKKAVSDFKEKKAKGEEEGDVVAKTEETTVTENENGEVVEEKVEETVIEKESEEGSTEDVVDEKKEVEKKESDVVEKKSQ